MYKKLLPMLLIVAMTFSIVGCSNRSPVSKNPTESDIETSTTIENNIIADDNTSNKEDNTSNVEIYFSKLTEENIKNTKKILNINNLKISEI